MTTTITQTSITNHRRCNSSDSAYYVNRNNHITILSSENDSVKRSYTPVKRSFSLQHNDDNITLVAEEDNTSQKTDYFSSVLLYLDSIYDKYSLAVKLKAKGNTARDHLANERTYLAWFRTSISLITLGIGIIQVYHVSEAKHKTFGRALGLIFVMASILFLYFGNVRYFHAQWALQHGNFPASRGIVAWASFCILFLFTGMFAVMLLERDMRL